jgi:tetratricopeptide (TPR) repeat protein
MKKYKSLLIISIFFSLLFIFTFLLSKWTALTIGLLILGAIGYCEKIFDIEITKKIRITLLIIFITLSICNIFYSSFKEYNASQKIQQANDAAEIAKKRAGDLSEKQKIAQIEIANLNKKDQELHQQLGEAEKSVKTAKKQINDLSDYGEVATYTFDGCQQSGQWLSPFTPVNKWAQGYLTVTDNKYPFKCNPDAMKYYQEIINKYPKFPFPYLALSGCLLKNQDPSWRKYAMKAKSILEITTKIPLHCNDHDRWLKQVNKILDPKQIKDVFTGGEVQSLN